MKKFLSILVGVILTFTFSSAVHAAPFQNGSFENGSYIDTWDTIWPGNGYITGWKLGGGLNYIGSYWKALDGDRSLQLNANDPSFIYQAFDTISGVTYNVSFSMSGNPDAQDNAGNPANKTMTVGITGMEAKDFFYNVQSMQNTHTDMRWENHIFQFTASSVSTTLTFTSTTPGPWGPVIDNVIISTVLPADKDMCKDGQWQTWNSFKSQGDCISYIATGGKNLPSGQ